MKKLFILLLLLCSTQIFAQGAFGAGGDLQPLGPYPIVKQKYIQGGLHVLTDTTLLASYLRDSAMVYQKSDDKLYRWQSGIWSEIPLGSPVLESDTIVTVANTGGDFNSLQEAIKWAKSKNFNQDTAKGTYQVTIKVEQGFNLTSPLLLSNGNYSNIYIKNATSGKVDTVYFKPYKVFTSIHGVFDFSHTSPPRIDSLYVIMDTSVVSEDSRFWGVYSKYSDFFISFNLGFENFDRGFNLESSSSLIIYARVYNCRSHRDYSTQSGTFGYLFTGGYSKIISCEADSLQTGSVVILQGSTIARRFHASAGNGKGGLTNRGGFVSVFSGDFRSDGLTNSPYDISNGNSVGIPTPGIIGLQESVLGGTLEPTNTVTSVGIIFKENDLVKVDANYGVFKDSLIVEGTLTVVDNTWFQANWLDNTETALTDGQTLVSKTGLMTATNVAESISHAEDINFSSITAGSFQSSTFTVSGVEVGDVIVMTPDKDAFTDNLQFQAWVNGANTIAVQAYNYTASAIDPALNNFYFQILKR
jgi:hypothetical protein